VTPEQITRWLANNGHRLDNPVQYLGDEPNAVRKGWAQAGVQVRWLLAASWPYFHSAGNQSIPAVYQAINDGAGYLADLSYLPETSRDMRILEKAGVPVFGIETKHEMADFDVVGTSISYMVLFMNFCKLLGMSGIPLRWKDRDERPQDWPMVLVGGQAFCAPGAMEPVVDAVWLGEVEDEPGNGGISAVCERIADFKSDGSWSSDRLACYKSLALEFPYLYFPRFVQVDYAYYDRGLPQSSKQVSGYRSLLPGQVMPRKSRHVVDMDKVRPLRSAPLLYTECGMGAGDLEVARGCPAWCGFCRLSWVTKPYRQRDVGLSVRHAAEWARNMGSTELSPFGPDFPMHTRKKELLARLLAEVSDEVDGTAMRIDDFAADEQYVLLQAQGGADTVTLGLEGSSQRMRDLVGKGTSDDDVVDAVVKGIRAGFRKFKIFMINNLPGEAEGDVLRAIELARRLAAVREEMGQPNVTIQFSFTPLLIEAQTPFQWFAPTPPDHTYIKVFDAFRDLKVQAKLGTKAEPNKVALFQLCQRASRDVGEAIVDVLERHSVASWGGVPKSLRDDLDQALRRHGFRNGLADCFDERGRHDLFGWEFIDTGVSQSLMYATYQQMVEFLCGTDPDTYDSLLDERYHGQEFVERCDTGCQGAACGACSGPAGDFRKRREYMTAAASGDRDIYAHPVRSIDLSSEAVRLRVQFIKDVRYRFVYNTHWRHSFRRAAYIAAHGLEGVLPEGTNISKRSIRFASDAIKVRDGSWFVDWAEFSLTRKVTEDQAAAFLQVMSHELSPWVTVHPTSWKLGPVSHSLGNAEAFYELEVPRQSEHYLEMRLAAWDEVEHIHLSLAGDTSYFGVSTEEANAKELLSQVWAIRRGSRLLLRFFAHGPAGPYQLAAAILGEYSPTKLMAQPAKRIAWLSASYEGDILAEACERCGHPMPLTLVRDPLTPKADRNVNMCPQCADIVNDHWLAGAAGLAV
jgi:radical SAM superfamily enzyme YgiQ (UPF0313 family)